MYSLCDVVDVLVEVVDGFLVRANTPLQQLQVHVAPRLLVHTHVLSLLLVQTRYQSMTILAYTTQLVTLLVRWLISFSS